MSPPNLDPAHSGAIPFPYVVTCSGGRQASLHRLPSGGVKLELTAPAKDGSRRVHGSLDFSAERAIEGLMAIALLCRMVDQRGLPGASD
jgi:hypothetical protein